MSEREFESVDIPVKGPSRPTPEQMQIIEGNFQIIFKNMGQLHAQLNQFIPEPYREKQNVLDRLTESMNWFYLWFMSLKTPDPKLVPRKVEVDEAGHPG